jgi:hypothetical protein
MLTLRTRLQVVCLGRCSIPDPPFPEICIFSLCCLCSVPMRRGASWHSMEWCANDRGYVVAQYSSEWCANGRGVWWHSTRWEWFAKHKVGTPLGRALCRSQGVSRKNLLGFGHSHCYSDRRLLGTKVSPRTRGYPHGPRREPFSSRVFSWRSITASPASERPAICFSGGAKSDER